MTSRFSRMAFAVAALVAASACTVHKTEAPPVSGPSELATALTLQASPDTLPQDGAVAVDRSVVEARDANGAAERRSTCASRSGQRHRAGLRTTVAPKPHRPAQTAARASPIRRRRPRRRHVRSLDARVAQGHAGRFRRRDAGGALVNIRLVPPGVITPPGGTAPDFTVSPDSPLVLQTVSFEAENDADITSYSWSFGDGGSATGRIVSHQYSRAGSFPVTLSATRNDGVVGTRSKSIDVGAGDAPVASFVFSPASPGVAETVFFNGAGSTATPPRQITNYQWDFGDGKGGGGSVSSHKYTKTGDFNVTLTVTDDSGQKGVTSNTVTVGDGSEGGLQADYTFSPTDPVAGTSVSFNASPSTSSSDPIVQYSWDFGDGGAIVNTSNKIANHTFAVTGTYTVTLTVKDSKGRTQTTSKTVSIG